ncbi:DUF4886 domain-containing protein, partial [Bacteroidota bacterium]
MKTKRIAKKTIIFISSLLFCINMNYINAKPVSNERALKILFIGSSYFAYNNLPQLFKDLVVKSGKNVDIYTEVTSGYLGDHAYYSSTDSKIKEQKWDYVILQGVGSLMAYPDYYTHHPVYSALQILKQKIISNCNTTKMVYCLPWAFEDGMTWVQGWTDDYADMQLKIYIRTLQYANDIGFVIAPVGWAWNTVLADLAYPLHYLHLSDWNHPSLKGSYLMACTIYSTVYQEECTDIPFYSSIDKQDARYFQDIASNTVMYN